METIITGIFADRDLAEGAIKDLTDAGVGRDSISYIHIDDEERVRAEEVGNVGNEVLQDAGGGAATGAAIGAIAGLIVAAGVLPGLGAVFVAGPLATALGLTGAVATTVAGAVTGAIAGGLIGALTGLGVAREDAEIYDERVRAGEILVIAEVNNETEANAAKDILRKHDADEVRSYTP